MAGEEDYPWEQPGAVRRDCELHRGRLLYNLGNVSLACGVLSFFFAAPGLAGLPLGLAVAVLARHDLGKMEAGLMDPGGWDLTSAALNRAHSGALGSGLGLVTCLVYFLLWLLGRLS